MRILTFLLAGVLFFFSRSYSDYRVHLKVLPENTYTIIVDYVSSKGPAVTKGYTNSKGEKDFFIPDVSAASQPTVTVKNEKYGGYVVLDMHQSSAGSKFVDTISVQDINGVRECTIRFLVDPEAFKNKQMGKSGTPASGRDNRNVEVLENEKDAGTMQIVENESGEIIGNNQPGLKHQGTRRIDPTRTPDYARKIASTGAACYFVGMGLSYITPFLAASVMTTNDPGSALGGLIGVLLIGMTSDVLEIAGTSYAVGGTALSWELGQGTCDGVNGRFEGWNYYKGGWVFLALGGAFGALTSLVKVQDQGTAITLTLISLGLTIGKDVFWSISNVKALTLSRKVKECLEEQPTPSYHMKLQLEPYAKAGGMGMRCSLLF
jgi:hypothetical protein